MFRIILAVLIAYLLYSLIKKLFLRKAKTSAHHAGETLPPGEMVPCEKCQTFVLKKDAIERGGKYYCSKGCIL